MSISLLESLRESFPADVIERAASIVDESPASTTKAVNATLPVMLGGLVDRADDPNVLASLVALLRQVGSDSDALRSPAAMLDGLQGTDTAAGDVGESMMATIFGGRLAAVSDAIGSFAGIRGSSARSILGMVAPLLLGVIGDRVKKDALDTNGLSRLLADQKGEVMAAMPTGLAGVAGLSGLAGATTESSRDLAIDARRRAAEVATGPTVPAERAGGGFNWLWPVLGVAAIAAIWFFTRGGGQGMDDDASRMAGGAAAALDSAGERVAAAAGGAVDAVSGWVKRTLPGGAEFDAPPGGIENRLVDFIENDDAAVNDTTWFEFDRLTFQTGSSTLTAESQDQLRNVAEILKAYPAVNVKIGGYTDNTGSAEANMTLSAERAAAVKRELEVLGISPTRLESEGYGAQHPVADNSTEEGRAQNRRIALRVTDK
jgi:outer membrane protein OmpA-like peptidoglycan-associated protein